MSQWQKQPDIAASRRQHRHLYQAQVRYLRYVGLLALGVRFVSLAVGFVALGIGVLALFIREPTQHSGRASQNGEQHA